MVQDIGTQNCMKIKNLVRDYLEKQPLFRERKNKDRGIVNILISRHYKLGEAIRTGVLSKEFVVEAMKEFSSMDRYWRQALDQEPELRGKDYNDRERLEQETELSLGYVPGHAADVKKLKEL